MTEGEIAHLWSKMLGRPWELYLIRKRTNELIFVLESGPDSERRVNDSMTWC